MGLGNISGVALAITLGGPGAIFWMWVIAIFGMSIKLIEVTLSMLYRNIDNPENPHGGPMWVAEKGFKKTFPKLANVGKILAILFSISIITSSITGGNMFQAWSVADVTYEYFGIKGWISGAILSLIVGAVLLGGIKRIAKVTATLVPLMVFLYVIAGFYILILNFSEIPELFQLIVTSAFTTTQATGAFIGGSAATAFMFGMKRAIFSNEAGLGSSPIAHAAAQTNSPVKQGSISMLEPLIDTLIVCSITAFVVLISGEWMNGINGAALTTSAFNQGLPILGKYIVVFGLILFAFSTIIGWSYYGEKCAEFIFGEKIIPIYRILWIIIIPFGAIIKLNLIWLIADIMNGLMALPNLIALLLLSPLIFTKTKELLNKT